MECMAVSKNLCTKSEALRARMHCGKVLWFNDTRLNQRTCGSQYPRSPQWYVYNPPLCMPLLHWIWLTCIHSRVWQCNFWRLGQTRHCSFVFFFLGIFTLGKSAAMSWGNSSSPLKGSSWEGTEPLCQQPAPACQSWEWAKLQRMLYSHSSLWWPPA